MIVTDSPTPHLPLRIGILLTACLLMLFVTRPQAAESPEAAEATEPEPAFEFDPSLPWLNVSAPLTLKQLQGKVVILDFWTYGCINCIHVLPDLKRLEEKHHPYLVVIGVHTPKFDREKNLGALRSILFRYGIEHPVVNDVNFTIGRYYGMRAWPTQVVLDPTGNPLGQVTGEGNFAILDKTAGDLIEEFSDHLDPGSLPMALEKEQLAQSLLAAPGKIATSNKRVAIADTLHHRIIVTDHSGTIEIIVGGPAAGYADGNLKQAAFSSPQGLAFDGDDLYVADTGNHRIRHIDLKRRTVSTIAGNGKPELARSGTFDALATGLRSPWGLALKGTDLYIAMAGNHQIWRLDLTDGKISRYAGSGREGLKDGALERSRFSQPSGLSIRGDWLYVADAEDSAVRRISLKDRRVETLIGSGLFDFGDRDGPFAEALLQHVLGVVALDDERVVIADTYNSKVKLLHLDSRRIETLEGNPKQTADTFNEPGGLARLGDTLLIADTNHHRIMAYDLKRSTLEEWPVRMPGDADSKQGKEE